MPAPSVERQQFLRVKLSNMAGDAEFQNGHLQYIDLYWADTAGPHKARIEMQPSIGRDPIAEITEWIEFFRFVRADLRRLRDGAQEAGE
jgi:hypothetical protein